MYDHPRPAGSYSLASCCSNFRGLMLSPSLSELVAKVGEYYSTSDEPLLLSRLGQKIHPDLRRQLVQEHGTLGAAIRAAGDDKLLVLCPVPSSGKEIVTTPERSGSAVMRTLETDARNTAHVETFDRLPTPVRVAFCAAVSDDQQIVLRSSPPFRYERCPKHSSPPPGFVAIEDEFRHPNLDVSEATRAQKAALWKSIDAWAARHGVNLEAASVTNPSATGGAVGVSALARFLDAQEPDILRRLRLPGDVARLLLASR